MMLTDAKRLSEASTVLDDRSVRKALAARRDRRLHAWQLAVACGAAGWEAGDPPERRWYVLATANRAEKDVENTLSRAGIEAWLPMRKVPRRRRSRRPVAERDTVLAPAFEGYVFVKVVDRAEGWAGLRGVEGVAGVLAADGKALPVGDEEVNTLKRMVDDGWFDRTVAARRFRKGQAVAIKDGPFAWLNGAFDGYAGTAHVRVLVALFGGIVPVKLDPAHIVESD